MCTSKHIRADCNTLKQVLQNTLEKIDGKMIMLLSTSLPSFSANNIFQCSLQYTHDFHFILSFIVHEKVHIR